MEKITIEQQIIFISEYIEEMDDDFDGSVLWDSNKKVYEAILETLQRVRQKVILIGLMNDENNK